MAQQVFNQWAPVAKAQNEQGQEVYLPFAGIHAQTRDGKDEVIVGAGNMVWTGSMWVPVSDQNRLPVEATLSGSMVSVQDITASVGTIPAGASVNVTVAVPQRATQLSLGYRFNGNVSDIRIVHLIGSFTAPALSEALTPLSGIYSIAGITKRATLLTNRVTVTITAGESDITPNPASNAGVKVYWWEG